MTREEALQRISELETELDVVKGMIRAKSARSIPIESIEKHLWLSTLWEHSESFKISISNAIRLACFGNLKHIKSKSPGGKDCEYDHYESLKIRDLNQEQYDKYKEVFEKVVTVIEPYITGGNENV